MVYVCDQLMPRGKRNMHVQMMLISLELLFLLDDTPCIVAENHANIDYLLHKVIVSKD
jgi:hypothetical protein